MCYTNQHPSEIARTFPWNTLTAAVAFKQSLLDPSSQRMFAAFLGLRSYLFGQKVLLELG